MDWQEELARHTRGLLQPPVPAQQRAAGPWAAQYRVLAMLPPETAYRYGCRDFDYQAVRVGLSSSGYGDVIVWTVPAERNGVLEGIAVGPVDLVTADDFMAELYINEIAQLAEFEPNSAPFTSPAVPLISSDPLAPTPMRIALYAGEVVRLRVARTTIYQPQEPGSFPTPIRARAVGRYWPRGLADG